MTPLKKSRNGASPNSGTALIKSESDIREYKFVTLKNGIEAILIRVPEGQSSKSAVAVTVAAGSMDEPDEFGGLAHFVEHCVFLGNKKYPNRNSLDKLLSKHNGYSNAHTELQYTAFYLEVNREGMNKAVDIFAAAFDSPLFDTEMCCAELEAVDSEFHEVLNNDDCRIEQLVCHLSDPGHPYKKFTWGNRNSLLAPRDENSLVSAAEAFYKRMYTPDRMKVSIVSSNSFAKMESWLNCFAQLSSSSTPTPPNPLIKCKFPISKLPLTLSIEPVSDIHQLIISFQIPSIIPFYKTKPVDYIAHLLGHESEGSLISVLRAVNLAVEISAGVGSDGYSNNSGLSIFEIKLTLTELGISQYVSILTEYVYPYIEECRAKGVVERVYMESKKISKFQFEKISEKSSEDPIDSAEELAIAMLPHTLIEPEDLLISEYLFDEFEAEKIAIFFAYLVPENALTMLVTKKALTALQEPIFGIKYSLLDNPVVGEASMKQEFTIPPLANPFIPTDSSPAVLAECSKNLFVVPANIETLENFKQYIFDSIRSIPSPKLDLRIQLSLSNMFTCADFVNTQVFVAYISDILESRLYAAKLAGYSVSIAASAPRNGRGLVGIEIAVHGYFEKVSEIAEMIILEILKFEKTDPHRLCRVIEMIRRGFVNEETHPVTSQALNARRVAIAPRSFFRSHQKLEVLTDNVFKPIVSAVDVIYVGANARLTAQRLESLLSGMIFAHVDENIPMSKVATIESLVEISEPTWNPTEPTGCLLIYYQLSPIFSVQLAAIADVLSDLMSEPFFDSLRTEEQLGYSVQCGSRSTNGSIGIEFMIQSSSEQPAEMISRIDRFIANFFTKEIAPMSEKEFQEQIEALVESLVEPPNSLATEAKDLWNEVNEGRYLWEFNQLIKNEIEGKFEKKSVKRLIQKHLVDVPRVVVMISKNM